MMVITNSKAGISIIESFDLNKSGMAFCSNHSSIEMHVFEMLYLIV